MDIKDMAAGLGIDTVSGPLGLLEDLAAQIGVDSAQVQQIMPQVLDLLTHLDLGKADGLINEAVDLFAGLLDGGEG